MIPWVVFTLAWLVLPGCAGGAKEIKVSEQIPSSYLQPIARERTEGSLWAGEQSRVFFFQDTQASHVGDIITVRIVENAKGTKGAKTKSSRSSKIAASTTAFLGIPSTTTSKLQANAGFDNQFDGSGSTSRSGALQADITAVVTDVLPNGNLSIQGHREVMINNEREIISISGIIRPEDIGPRNTILSIYVAEANIEYSGKGVINDKQHPGWLIRIIDWVWPF